MPELPEIEVLKRSLEPRLVGRRVLEVRVHSPALREPLDRSSLESLAGRRIVRLSRRSKYLLLEVERGATLVIHLGMSGRLTLAPASAEREAHEHLSLRLDDAERLRLRDPRRFGLAFVAPTREIELDRHFRHLGAEPLAPALTGIQLSELARGRRGPVKSFLMDGRLLVGVGNIYATEALYRAGIHPARSVARIGAERWQRLADAVVATLEQAITEGGTTLNDFRDGAGREGEFQESLAVYGRAGEACPACGASLRRLVQAGRSTFYCPRCQR
ncbi:MAG: bifunctional DNA-formamidopyrimidine glycosylase/DNA-(apurinic or apyrimidinic site) lyase [Thermoanaerobaculia bacterium]|jgi:formamidopyrimidine-DNA glycosylase|nr:bifunctional DNA-formamidopyrimidine glycosylase/DNA-(apurinic or apyrimidinic site) lyase [Thermoanaerobaculia bacterium]MBP9823313.1 bifunctional DNA-formamidopyrimidine glycosylase/DNA-(apurinic or apyrimidinic site) lyase [Thermoanaerobaculia bacterium]